MENKKSLNQFQKVHKQVRERLEHIREAQEKDTEFRKKREIDKVFGEGFDSTKATT